MVPEPLLVRPPSLLRRLGKTGLFLSRGIPPGTAWWLACHEAPVGLDYRGVALPALRAAYSVDPSWAELEASGGTIRSRLLGLAFGGEDLVRHGYATCLALSRLGWRFTRTDRGTLLAESAQLKLELTTEEDCDMIREIHLVPRCYDVRLPGSWDVVDIGGNVGMAALFFATQPWCHRVHSFEPFSPTAAAYRHNVGLNPGLAGKIALREVGVGETDATMEVDYNPQLRGSMSITGLGAWRGQDTATTQKVAIKIERARTALAPILAGSRPLFAKIDCEGSEYGILRDLAAGGLLTRFSALVIEWHGEGSDELVAILLAHGFAVQVTPLCDDPRTLGLIHATRLPAAV